jgi:NAD+ kinase
MATIGLVVRPDTKAAQSLGQEMIRWAVGNSHTVLLEENTAKIFDGRGYSGNYTVCTAEELPTRADPIVTLGGDGTLIGIARYVKERSPVIIGVNFGNLGFLTEIAPSELFPTLDNLFSGKASYGERAMIRAVVERAGTKIYDSQAVNDVSILKDSRGKLLDLDLSVNHEEVARIRGDGLIIATPTGSTAYSLAAGGSIVFPSLSAMLVTPLCPHSLTSRPFILPLSFGLGVSIPEYEGNVFLSIDGQDSQPLEIGDSILVTQAENSVRFVKSPSKSYFEILRTKLNWGVANKSH